MMSRNRTVGALLTAVALLGLASPTPATPVSASAAAPSAMSGFYAQTLTWRSCHKKLQCAKFQVPLDYAHPEGARISIMAARYLASGTAMGSLFVNPGGPGASGIEYIADPEYAVSPKALRTFDLVSFDPRAVGESTPLWCYKGTKLDAFLNLDPTPDTVAEQKSVQAAGVALASSCRRENAALMQHVSAADIARDMDVLRGLLGEEHLRYVGKSWGTVLGKVYAALFPEHVGSFVLDGAVDLTIPANTMTYQQAQGFESAIDRFIAWCVDRKACVLGTSTQAAKRRLVKFVHDLDAHPMRTDNPKRPFTEAQAITTIIGPMYIGKDGWQWLHDALIPAFTTNNAQALQEINDWFVERDGKGAYANNGNTAIYFMNCLDQPNAGGSLAETRALAAAWTKKLPFMGAAMAWSDLPCATWPFHAETNIHTMRVTDVPPALVIGGTFDPATPLAWSRGLASQWPGAALLVHSGDGHTSYDNGSTCIDGAVDAFLMSDDYLHPELPTNGMVCDATTA